MIIGLVGKPSSGKSSTFKAMTLADVPIASYPFTTIEPNRGAGFARIECVDKEFNTQCNPRMGYCIEHNRFIPVELIDVAGLVPDAHLGKGKGNQFLDDLRQADVLIHVVDISGSTNAQGEAVEPGSHDPAKDIEFLVDEIDMWFYGIIEKGWDRFARRIMLEGQKINHALQKQLSGLNVKLSHVDIALKKLKLEDVPLTEWSPKNLKELATEFRKMTKPIIISANKIDTPTGMSNFERLRNNTDYIIVPASAESEIALKQAARAGMIRYIPGDADFEIAQKDKLNEKQIAALEFIRENVLKKYGSTGVQKVLDDAVFRLLKYIAIFPGGINNLADSKGRVLPDCFLMPGNSTALDFAYKLHTDFGKNFIRAIDVKTKRTVGKEHALKHRDVVEIVT